MQSDQPNTADGCCGGGVGPIPYPGCVDCPRRTQITDLYDVVAVNIKTGAKRTMATDIGVSNAEAIIKMAVMRRGVKEEFYMAIPVNERDGGWAE